ncbi:MAG: UPF0489 family protein [Candidatus Thorarchaeota archaeon]
MDKILDIDLDFFLNKVSASREDGKRLNKKKYYPWKKTAFKSFLENRCLLSKERSINGRIVKKHHEAFFFWRDLILQKKVEIPFELVHIDAHSDIGIADWGWIYITSELLNRPVEDRIHPDESLLYGINEANYLAFALACRWIKKLTFVIHPKWENDLTKVYFKNFDFESGIIQLNKFKKKELLDKGFSAKPISYDFEPQIPVKFIELSDYKNEEKFTLLTCSHSKTYTPRKSDMLLRVLKAYIKKL